MSVTNAVAKRDQSPAAIVAQYSGDFAKVLPSHVKPETWVRLAQGALRRNKQLAQAAGRNPGSLMTALLDAARLGLDPGTEQYYLVPYGNEVTGITGYQGEIELIYRAGAVASVKAEIVYANDEFEYSPDMDRPHHKPNWFADRGDMIGVYAYAEMKDGGTSRVVVMSKADIEKVKAVSKAAKSPSSPWNQWPDRMWLKTAVHQLAKWVPTSAEYRREQLRALAEAQAVQNRPESHAPGLPASDPHQEAETAVDAATGEILDGEVVDDAGWPGAVSPADAEALLDLEDER